MPSPLAIVVVGDSITVSASAGDARYALCPSVARARHNYFALCYGTGAAGYGGGLFGSAWRINIAGALSYFAEAYVFAGGTNDYGGNVPLADMTESLAKALRGYQKYLPTAALICVTPLWRKNEQTPNTIGLDLQAYRDAIAATCSALGLPVIDGSKLVPHDVTYYVDGLHPNPEGYAVMAQRLVEALQPILGR